MPVTVEVKPEYFHTWSGRIKVIEIILGILCMSCCAPAYYSTQHWFLVVVVFSFMGTLYFLLHHLFVDTYVKNLGINWMQTEFWFTALATFLYFTAFMAQLIEFSGWEDKKFQYWIDAQVAAGVFALFNDVAYGVGAYFIYGEWRANPEGMTNNPTMPPA